MKWFKQLAVTALIAVVGFSSIPSSTPSVEAASKLSGKIVINGIQRLKFPHPQQAPSLDRKRFAKALRKSAR
jgi:hypothetical protein